VLYYEESFQVPCDTIKVILHSDVAKRRSSKRPIVPNIDHKCFLYVIYVAIMLQYNDRDHGIERLLRIRASRTVPNGSLHRSLRVQRLSFAWVYALIVA
jgi:hypothetical protein